MLIDGAATDEVDERGLAVSGDTLLLMMNSGDAPVSFTLPALRGEAKMWVIMVDTARDETAVVKGTSVTIEAHSVLLLRFGLDRRIRALEEPRREPLTLVDRHTL
jgi:pullulanase/glycogen debranching enzyme